MPTGGRGNGLVPGVIIGLTFTPVPECVDPINTNVTASADSLTRAERAAYNAAHPPEPDKPAPPSARDILAALAGAGAVVDCATNRTFGGCAAALFAIAPIPISKVARIGGGATTMYRVSPIARGTSELDHGLNPAHFPRTKELDGSAHFGNEARANDFARSHVETHGQGFKVTVPNTWIRGNEIAIWEGRTPDQLEYIIPRELFDGFNQFPREPWVPGGSR